MVRVACCWDGGVETDIRLVEMFCRYHAKAAFHLNYGSHYRNYRRKAGWQLPENPGFINRKLALAEMPQGYRGFQIASHGYFHADCHKVPPIRLLNGLMSSILSGHGKKRFTKLLFSLVC